MQKSVFLIKKALLPFMLALLLTSSPAIARPSIVQLTPTAPRAPAAPKPAAPSSDDEIPEQTTIQEGDTVSAAALPITDDSVAKPRDNYLPTSITNLSKLYWAIGKLDLNNDQAIDDYMMINECSIYQQYFHNDIEWAGIRQAARETISKNMGTFPTRFEMVIPIRLGRYDSDSKAFEVEQGSALTNARKMDIATNFGGSVCGHAGEIEEYPKNIVLLLNRPFTFNSVPVNPELADLYINETQAQIASLPEKLRVMRYERMAYLRMKVRIFQYKDTIIVHARYLRALVFGRLESFEVYADQAQQKLLYSQVVKDEHPRPHRKDTDSTADTETPDVGTTPPASDAQEPVSIPAYGSGPDPYNTPVVQTPDGASAPVDGAAPPSVK